MAQIQNRPLGAVEQIYRLPGGNSLREFDDKAAIQPVHDVAAHAGIAQALLVGKASLLDTGAPSTAVFEQVTIQALLNEFEADLLQLGMNPRGCDVWLLSASSIVTSVTAANYERSALGVRTQQGNDAIAILWESSGINMRTGGAPVNLIDPTSAIAGGIRLPYRLDRDRGQLLYRAASGGGGSAVITIVADLFIAARGVVPW